VWLKIDFLQNAPNAARADGWDNAIKDSLAGHVSTGPMGDVQPFGHRFQARQLDDPRSLQWGNLGRSSRSLRLCQHPGQSEAFLTAAGTAHGINSTLHLKSYGLSSLASSDGQHNTSRPNLKPRQSQTAGKTLQFDPIRLRNQESMGFATTHDHSYAEMLRLSA
jgi:hypothetical protein